jgi:F-type H+-transporting ATPase subunit epsilon
MSLELTIITADKRFHFPGVTQVVIPTPQGQTGILPGHAPLVSLVVHGVLRIFPADPEKASTSPPSPILFALATGLARIFNDHIVLLMNEACAHDEIDPDKAISRSHELALAQSSHAPLGRIDRQDLEDEAGFANAQLEVLKLTGQAS